jgi:hypothetical protein
VKSFLFLSYPFCISAFDGPTAMILAVYYSFAPQSYGNHGQKKERDTHILSGGNGL